MLQCDGRVKKKFSIALAVGPADGGETANRVCAIF
jgi:hypothetical protein